MKRCEEYNTRRKGICDRPLDEHGNCDRASEHGDHLEEDRVEQLARGPWEMASTSYTHTSDTPILEGEA